MRLRPRGLTVLLVVMAGVAAVTEHPASAQDRPEPSWCVPMRALHENFHGDPGYVAQLGDSITFSLAFWAPVGWDEPGIYLSDDGLPKNPRRRWRDSLKGFRDKGPGHGNQTGWTSATLDAATDPVLDHEKPEVAIIMIGTNDIGSGQGTLAYQQHLESIVAKCLKHHCIPILNTIPPRAGAQKASEDINDVVRQIALQRGVPLVDYYAEILKRRPGKSWEHTLLDKDGVHPNNDNGKANVYTSDNLAANGYALRNYLDFMAVREVYFLVLHPDQKNLPGK